MYDFGSLCRIQHGTDPAIPAAIESMVIYTPKKVRRTGQLKKIHYTAGE
jgi:hypothetical protein